MKKVIKENWESYDSDGLDIALTEFAAGVATYIQRSHKAEDTEHVIESVADDIRLQVLSFLKDEEYEDVGITGSDPAWDEEDRNSKDEYGYAPHKKQRIASNNESVKRGFGKKKQIDETVTFVKKANDWI